jgi:hypothetical protein
LEDCRTGSTSSKCIFSGQAADVVVALDDMSRIAADRDALDDVGIERALREEAIFVPCVPFACLGEQFLVACWKT